MHLFILTSIHAHARMPVRSNGVADKGCSTLLQRVVHLYVLSEVKLHYYLRVRYVT